MTTVAKLMAHVGVTGIPEAQKGLRAVGKDVQSTAGHIETMGKKAGPALGGVMDGLGKLGLAGMGLNTLAQGARGLGESLGIGLNAEVENVSAQLNAFTKDGAKSAEILEQIRNEAAKTPFQFQEMAKSTASLMSSAKAANEPLMNLVKDSEILAASNPAQGLEGAAFALREAVSGDFTSIIERFNLPRSYINQLKAEGVPALEIVRRSMQEMGLDMDVVSNLSKTASGRWSTLNDTFDTLKQRLSAPLFTMLSSGLEEVQKQLDANQGTLNTWADNAGSALSGVASVAGKALRGDLRGAFSDMLGAVQEHGSKIAEQLQSWAREFVAWIQPMIPPFLQELGALARRAFAWIQERAPEVLTQLGQWGQKFIDFVIDATPPMLRELGSLASKFLDWITIEGPTLASKFLKEWLPAAIDWVKEAAIKILPKLGEFIGAVTGWIVSEGLPKLVTFGAKMGGAILDGIGDGLKNLGSALWGWIMDAIKAINIDLGWIKISGTSGVSFNIPSPPIPSLGGGNGGGSGSSQSQAESDWAAASYPDWAVDPTGGTDVYGNAIARASGGPVWPGGLFMVGEQGPELFRPKTGGEIIPLRPAAAAAGAIGGGTTVNIHVSGNTVLGDDYKVAHELARIVAHELDRNPNIPGWANAWVQQSVQASRRGRI